MVFRIFVILLGIFQGFGQADYLSPETNPASFESAVLPDGSFGKYKLDSLDLYQKVDSLMSLAIGREAFPGAQVLVAYKGEKIYHKTFGFHTYDSLSPVAKGDLYDLASVTKITAGLPAVMKLQEAGIIALDDPLSETWKPWRRSSDKSELTWREILAHQAGLKPYIVFLSDVRHKRKPGLKRKFVRTSASTRFSLQAYEDRFINRRFPKKMYRGINKSAVSSDKTYRYSGLAFLLIPEIVRQQTGLNFDTYLFENVYGPLGLSHTSFLPELRQPGARIVPTEQDTLYRNTLTRGWVHDENASLLGGVSANAGLFSTADDLAVIMQCFANYGRYNGKQIFDANLVEEYARVQYPENENRRGVGFDKPLLENASQSLNTAYPAPLASAKSFGHGGFTGTFVWADPENQLVFIFLSNRVYPDRSHRQLYELKVRTQLHQWFYEALLAAQ
ncbi:CubicO group peptidase, beta-lactamase class C family [Robiginitalea myxolifaciens]|uniref:CubicO group peptidase, beta-lactamase class C family n=1 Tax=Robiginitalea myxolifaciens TaxID=400055 RepID=A0A1I6G0D6_9FLAO|nr:CubicO group peptidase, beta-lactamase class C family [Robiginitalea myxolifaciens]